MPIGPQRASELLGSVRLFASLDDDERRLLAERSRVSEYRSGDTICSLEGGDHVYACLAGGMQLCRLAGAGEVAAAYYGPGDTFGLADLATAELSSFLRATRDATIVCRIPRAEVDRLIRDHPEVDRAAREGLARELRAAHEWMDQFAFNSVQQRLAWTLARLARVRGETSLQVTQSELAGMIRTSREEVGRGLQTLRDEGLLMTEDRRGTITILDENSLTDRGNPYHERA